MPLKTSTWSTYPGHRGWVSTFLNKVLPVSSGKNTGLRDLIDVSKSLLEYTLKGINYRGNLKVAAGRSKARLPITDEKILRHQRLLCIWGINAFLMSFFTVIVYNMIAYLKNAQWQCQ